MTRTQRSRRTRWGAALAFLVLTLAFAAVVLWAQEWGPFPGDVDGLYWVDNPKWSAPQIGPMVHLMDVLADPGLAVLTLLVAVAAWARASRREAIAVLLGATAIFVSGLLKTLIGPTPLATEHGLFHGQPGMPSGHVVWAVTFYGTIGLLAWRRGYWEVVLSCAAIVAAMGPSRVLVGVHLISDVVAGYLFGALWLVAVGTWLSRAPRRGSRGG